MNKTDLNIKIEKAAQGSEEALNFLLGKYKPLIDAEISRHTGDYMTRQDIADMRQEAEIAFCNAVCNYDESLGGVEFGLFAKICIGNALVSFVRSYNRRECVVSIENKDEVFSERFDPIERLIEQERLIVLQRRIQASLSPYENKVWWMYVSGASAKEIAESLSVAGGVKSVNNAIYRIRKKLRSVIEKN